MRLVVAFLVLAALWLALGGWQGIGEDRLADIRRFFVTDTVDTSAPNWGNVASKIGELAAERGALTAEINDGAAGGDAAAGGAIPPPDAKPR